MSDSPAEIKHISFLGDQEVITKFRRALRRADQLALDDLFSHTIQHEQAARLVDQSQPMETLLLAMLIEEHKQVMQLKSGIEKLLTSPSDRP
jgi:hypothetical protein